MSRPYRCVKKAIKENLGTTGKCGYGLDLNMTVWNYCYFLIYDNDTAVTEKNVLTSRRYMLKYLQVKCHDGSNYFQMVLRCHTSSLKCI